MLHNRVTHRRAWIAGYKYLHNKRMNIVTEIPKKTSLKDKFYKQFTNRADVFIFFVSP